MKPLIAIPITILIDIRAYRRKSLTPIGILTASITAGIHALHPSPLPFTLLAAFFLIGTFATKVKHEIKSTLTLTSGGGSGGEGPRTSIQVLANSGCVSILCLIHAFKYGIGQPTPCFDFTSPSNSLSSILLVGIIANYVSVTADTLSSELGILSKSQPILITNPTLRVPKGTNGGITPAGIAYGFLGSAAIAGISMYFLPFCSAGTDSNASNFKYVFTDATSSPWTRNGQLLLFALFAVWGALGSLLDSFLGAVLQASVVDRRSGKVVEGAGGIKVLTRTSFSNSSSSSPTKRKGVVAEKPGTPNQESRYIGSGKDLLDNNQINFLMASLMTVGAMGVVGAIGGRVTASNML